MSKAKNSNERIAKPLGDRVLIKELETKTDLRFVTVNKPGASHNIGYQYVNETNKPTLFISTDTVITNKGREGYPDGIVDKIQPIFLLGHFTNIVFVNSKNSFSRFKYYILLHFS